MCGFCNVWVCVCVGGCCMYGFCNVWVCVCVGVLIICVLVFTVFLYCLFIYIYSYLLLQPSENSIAINDNNNTYSKLYKLMCVCTYTHTQGSLSEIHTRTYWNLIGRSNTAPPPVSSPRNIPPSLSAYFANMPARKFRHTFK